MGEAPKKEEDPSSSSGVDEHVNESRDNESSLAASNNTKSSSATQMPNSNGKNECAGGTQDTVKKDGLKSKETDKTGNSANNIEDNKSASDNAFSANATAPTVTKNTNKNPPVQKTNNPSTSSNMHNAPTNSNAYENNADYPELTASDKDDTLHTMSFNQDGGCLAVGTGTGFRICNVYPFQETFRRRLDGGNARGSDGGGIAQIEMLYRTNLLALTGTNTLSSTPSHYPPNKVLIYDDHLQKTIGELSFRQKVLATKLRRDRIVVVLRDRVYVYNFSDLGLLDKVHTGDNPRGLVGISMDNGGVGGSTVERAEDVLGVGVVGSRGHRNGLVLACPSTQRGQVRVELYGLRRTTFVDAHESALGALALSVDGSLLATASERGTVIRLFDTRGVTVGGGKVRDPSTSNGNSGGGTEPTKSNASLSSSIPLREFRRGVDRATISCLTFSLDSCWLAAASDHGTVHIFQSHDANAAADTSSKASSSQKSISSMTGKAIRMLPKIVISPTRYLMDGEQSYAQVRGIPHPRACAFVPDRECTIAIAGEDEYGNGCLLLAEFGSNADENIDDSEARRLCYHRFFKKDGAAAMHGKSSRRRVRSKELKGAAELEEGGAFIDDNPTDLRMNHISIGDENEDEFVPIDYDAKK
ncbi:hypothetical protein HJC23_000940 [Cyclotella cryptica]|uniref:Uncharacterized protein n=1 Tax=Cyclotella cryptica TaxID=29204 RepID=A0ABD3QN35_9STRA